MWMDKAIGVHAWEIPIERYNLYSKASTIHVANNFVPIFNPSNLFNIDDLERICNLRPLSRPI